MGCTDCGKEDAYLGVKVLNKMKVDVEVKDFSCGCEFYGTDPEKIEHLKTQNQKLLNKYDDVVVGCARCFHVLKTHYPDKKVHHISQVIYDRLKHTKRSFVGSGEVFYHDPCFLSRYEKVFDEPRKSLERLGYEVREFKNCRERTDCCGDYSPIRVMRERASELRLSQLPKIATVTAACPKCTQNFASFNKSNSKISVRHYLELVDDALNIEIPAVY